MTTSLMMWMAATVVAYAVGRVFLRPLSPPFVALELAASQNHAKRVCALWQEKNYNRRALGGLAVGLFALIPLYTVTAFLLIEPYIDKKMVAVKILGYILLIAVVFAAIAHAVENVLLAVTLITRPRATVVFATRMLAWFKYMVLALSVLYALLRGESSLYARIGSQGSTGLAVLVALTVAVAFHAAQRMTTLSRDHPPLLALQLAPSRLAAKAVMEHWGKKGRRAAEKALLFQSIFAVLYGVALAAIFEAVNLRWTPPVRIADYFPAAMLAAAACHLAQNVGAYIALFRREMGWWVGSMRVLGRLRIALLAVAALYLGVLLIRAEANAVQSAATRLAAVAKR